jgi:hypothetical protein
MARLRTGIHLSWVILAVGTEQMITGHSPRAGRRSAMPSHDGDMSRRYDVAVIGAGPAGEAAAELGGSWAVGLPSRASRI